MFRTRSLIWMDVQGQLFDLFKKCLICIVNFKTLFKITVQNFSRHHQFLSKEYSALQWNFSWSFRFSMSCIEPPPPPIVLHYYVLIGCPRSRQMPKECQGQPPCWPRPLSARHLLQLKWCLRLCSFLWYKVKLQPAYKSSLCLIT